MTDYGNVTGGEYNGIWTLVPEECQAQVDPNSASQQGSEQFLIERWSEYVSSLMVTLTPGIVLGSISAAGLLVFAFWACLRWSRRYKIREARLAKKEARMLAKQGAAKQAAEGGRGGGGTSGTADRTLPEVTNGGGAKAASMEAAAMQGEQQFMTSADGAGKGRTAEAAACEEQSAWKQQQQRWWQAVTAGRLLKWLIVLLALATIGVSAWGIAESISATNGLIDDFWTLVNRARDLVVDLGGALEQLGVSLGDVATTLDNVQNALQKIVDTVNGIPVIGGLIGRVLPMDKINELLGPTADNAVNALRDASVQINGTVLPIVNDRVLPTLDNVMQYETWTSKINDTWRYIVIAVLFGLLILVSAGVALACLRMRRGVAASSLVAALWGLNAVVMFLGFGLFQGAKSVANDACLYSEESVYRLVRQRLEGNTEVFATNALDYYFGRVDLVDSNNQTISVGANGTDACDPELTAALLRQVAGIELHSALVYAWKVAELLPDIGNLLGGINLPTIPLVNFDLDTIKDPIVIASDQMQGLLEDVCNVTLLLVRENHVWPLYVDAKAYICCDLTSAIHDVWVPWTVAGVLALVLSVLASFRVITSTLAPTGRTSYAGGGKDGGAAEAGAGDGGIVEQHNGKGAAGQEVQLATLQGADAAEAAGEAGVTAGNGGPLPSE